MPRKTKPKEEHVHNPGVAAVLNFIIWGTGYIYNRRRVAFGVGLIIVELLVHLPILLLGFGFYAATPRLFYPILLGHLLLSVILAYDGYKEAVKIRG